MPLYGSYHVIDDLSFFLFGKRTYMMEEKHRQELRVQPLLLRATNNRRLC